MLDIQLEHYAKSNYYPFHMPGHKRAPLSTPNPYTMDITEIEGFDNLHAPESILKDAARRAAELYDSKKSYYMEAPADCLRQFPRRRRRAARFCWQEILIRRCITPHICGGFPSYPYIRK